MNRKTPRLSSRPRKVKGFTLLELIIVLAIISVLAAIIVPNTVSRMRDARIESANATAKEIYFAVQDYCTDMQIKHIPLIAAENKPAAFPLSSADANNRIGVEFVGHKSDVFETSVYTYSTLTETVNGKAEDNANPDCKWGFIGLGGNVVSADVNSTTDETKNKGGKAITGITNYLGTTLGSTQVGSFIAVIDVNTYSVDYVVFSDQPSAVTDCEDIVHNGIYTQTFGFPANKGRSQEYDTNENNIRYVGQYPIIDK